MTVRTVKVFPTSNNVEQPDAHVTDGDAPILLRRLVGVLQAQVARLTVMQADAAVVTGINKHEFGIWIREPVPDQQVQAEQLAAVRAAIAAAENGGDSPAKSMAAALRARLDAIAADR